MTRLLPILLIFLFGCLTSTEAQDPKAWLGRISTEPPGPFKDVRPMKISYGLSWKGRVNAGKMEIVLTEPYEGIYLSKAGGQSVGLARALFPYDFGGTCQTNADTLKPLTFNFADRMKTKSYKYSILFQPNQMIANTEMKDHKTGNLTPYRGVYRFEKDVGLDLMSSILYVRSQPLHTGQRISLVTATFNKPYLTEYRVLGREKKSLKGGKTYNTVKLDLKISKIHPNMTAEPYSKIEKATVWISDDAYRIPIEFQGEIFVGYICARMTSRKFL